MQGIEREYNELDTVWFMAGSLFHNYPWDIPTEAFSLKLFTQVLPYALSTNLQTRGRADRVHLRRASLPPVLEFALHPLEEAFPSYFCSSPV